MRVEVGREKAKESQNEITRIEIGNNQKVMNAYLQLRDLDPRQEKWRSLAEGFSVPPSRLVLL